MLIEVKEKTPIHVTLRMGVGSSDEVRKQFDVDLMPELDRLLETRELHGEFAPDSPVYLAIEKQLPVDRPVVIVMAMASVAEMQAMTLEAGVMRAFGVV